MKSLYLLVNLGAFIVPFLFSFHPKLAFYKKWRYVFPAIALSALPFLLWDASFTEIGVWGFNERYVSGIKIYNLPLEEVLFFICIPYSCLFTYHCLTILVRKDVFKCYKDIITTVLLILLVAAGLIFFNRLYSSFTFIGLAMMLMLVKFYIKPPWLSRFYFSYLILLLPFSIVNGILTGTGLDAPVVWYNNSENLGFRLMTIPLEDIFYGMFLILLNTLTYEYLARKNREEKDPHISV
jgi:lycopene cyclase domain-containing protein